jgi:hypothetical protein
VDFQAQEQAAIEKKEKIDEGLGPKGGVRADYWRWLKPVLERRGPSKPLQCLLKCTRGGEGVCGKLLSSENPSKSAKEHFMSKGCMGVRQEEGQVRLFASQQQQALSKCGAEADSNPFPCYKFSFS